MDDPALLDLDALAGRGGGAGHRVVAELVALDLDALAAVVTVIIEHVASPSSTSMRSPHVASPSSTSMRSPAAVAVVAQLDLDALSPAAVAARVAELAAVAMRWSPIAAAAVSSFKLVGSHPRSGRNLDKPISCEGSAAASVALGD